MSITNLERRIRFSNLSKEEYGTLTDTYTKKLLPVLMENTEFVATLEAKETHVMSKRKLEQEATKLSAHSDPMISQCGKAVLQFLAIGVRSIDEALLAITSVILAGGVILSTCITVIIGFILYAVTVCPSAILITALTKQHDALGKVLDNPKDRNIQVYKTVVANIMSKPNGVEDIHELSRMTDIAESVRTVVECDATKPDENPVVHECCSILRAIDERIGQSVQNNSSVITLATFEMQLYSDLAPADYTYSKPNNSLVMESVDFGTDDGTELYMMFENVVKAPLLSGEGLMHGIICTVTDAASRETILEFLNRYKDTVKYEFTHEAYSDIPILNATNAILEFVAERCTGNAELMESLQYTDQVLGGIIDEAYNEVTEDAAQGGAPVVCANPSTTDTGFNPDPYNIGLLTPFPVASRKVGSLLCDICKAETDEELTEAMLNFGRVATVITESYTVDGDDINGYVFMESGAGKAARRASDKANQKFSKTATKDKTGGVKEAVKRTIDPMEKFIQKQYDTLKEKDANERRNIILKGGALPKVLRWVKRGIGLLVGATVGQLIPAAAVITGIVFLGYIATDKYLDHKERAKLLRELEDEIQICNEKIDDSRGDDNKQNKYELMRIRNQLTRTSEKIRLGLKY